MYIFKIKVYFSYFCLKYFYDQLNDLLITKTISLTDNFDFVLSFIKTTFDSHRMLATFHSHEW